MWFTPIILLVLNCYPQLRREASYDLYTQFIPAIIMKNPYLLVIPHCYHAFFCQTISIIFQMHIYFCIHLHIHICTCIYSHSHKTKLKYVITADAWFAVWCRFSTFWYFPFYICVYASGVLKGTCSDVTWSSWRLGSQVSRPFVPHPDQAHNRTKYKIHAILVAREGLHDKLRTAVCNSECYY